MSPHINYYTKVNGRWARGFGLNRRRFSVHRLRARFFNLFKFFKMLRFSYAEALESLKRSIVRSNCKRSGGNGGGSSSRRNLVVIKEERNVYRLSSLGRSNSFYSEAIADCLEFIKRSSLSVDDKIASQR